MTNVVITSATRTPIGSFGGALSGLTAMELGTVVIGEALKRAKIDPADVSDVVMGQVLTAACGQNPARQASMKAGVPKEVPAMTINMVSGSGLWDAFNGYHMGTTAENIAEKWQLTRASQDEFAANSQIKAEAAIKAGRFKDEIVPVTIMVKREQKSFDADEYPRAGTTADTLGKLKPAFSKDGTVTAGNASGINDGAAAVTLMSEADAKARGLKPLARIASWAQAGVDPAIMGTGPIPASRRALEKAGWSVNDLDLIEANEAFAAQSLAVCKDLGFDPAKVNVNGGAIALGHPIGASGCRVLVTLLHELQKRGGKKGLATLCIGGGMGIALCVEAL